MIIAAVYAVLVVMSLVFMAGAKEQENENARRAASMRCHPSNRDRGVS